MLCKTTCKKCGESFKLDIGKKSIEEVKKQLSKQNGFECPGHHVELNSPMDYWVLGEIIEGSIQSESDWLESMKKNGRILYSNDDVRELFNCTGFSCGVFCGTDKKTKESIMLDFSSSPEGNRYYYRI